MPVGRLSRVYGCNFFITNQTNTVAWPKIERIRNCTIIGRAIAAILRDQASNLTTPASPSTSTI